MKFTESRTASFLIVFIVYVLASALGVWLFAALPYSLWLNLLLADISATILTFIFSLIFKNASVYDPYWSVQPIVIVLGLGAKYGLNALGILFTAVICLWGIRLTANWAYTFKNLKHQDWRYTMLHEKTGVFYPLINFIGIHMVPTLVVYGCVLPAAIAIESAAKLCPLAIIFLALSTAAFTIQGVADIEMHRFRKRRQLGQIKEAFNRDGLWKHSRHPNYLGEILMWWGVGLAAVSAMPEKPYLLMGAAANTVLFLFVSIPMADRRQSRKPGYKEYRQETRSLI